MNNFTKLLDRNARLVLLNGKQAFWKEWQLKNPTIEQVTNHSGNIGIEPASIGCVVLDVDKGGAEAVNSLIDYFGKLPLATIPSGKPNRFHVWYRMADSEQVKNVEFAYDTAEGDIKCKGGIAALYHPDKLAAALDNYEDCESIRPDQIRDIYKKPKEASYEGLLKELADTQIGARHTNLGKVVFNIAKRNLANKKTLEADAAQIKSAWASDNPPYTLSEWDRRFNNSWTEGKKASRRKDIQCVLDHDTTEALKREREAADRIIQDGRFACFDKAFHYFDSETSIWHRLTNSQSLDFLIAGGLDLGLCRHCRTESKATVFANLIVKDHSPDRANLLLVKTADKGYVTIDCRNGYEVRKPRKDDYLTGERYIEIEGLMTNQLLEPRTSDYPLKTFLTGDQEGQWRWTQDAYDYFLISLARGALRITKERRIAALVNKTGSGKGTTLNTIEKALGGYTTRFRTDEFVNSQFGAAKLEECGIAIFDEQISHGLLKRLKRYTDGTAEIERKFMDSVNIQFGGLFVLADVTLPSLEDEGEHRRSVIFENQYGIERKGNDDDGGKIKAQIVEDSALPLLLDILRCVKTRQHDAYSILPSQLAESTSREWRKSDDVSNWIEAHCERKEGVSVLFSEVKNHALLDMKNFLTDNHRTTTRIKKTIQSLGYEITGGTRNMRVVDCVFSPSL